MLNDMPAVNPGAVWAPPGSWIPVTQHRKKPLWSRPWCVLLVVVASLVGSIGIAFLYGSISQGSIPSSAYVVNRNGDYYVGSRCAPTVVAIDVFLEGPPVRQSNPAYYDTAVWHAVAHGGVAEFKLFAPDQPGVEILVDGIRPPMSSNFHIAVQERAGRWAASVGDLTAITPNMVRSEVGLTTWDEFMKVPNARFYC